MADHPAAPTASARETWERAWFRIAWIAGVFSLLLGGVLVVNTCHLYRGPGNGKIRLVEAGELKALKATLREDPKNQTLKDRLRLIDQQQRADYFRREQLASRGGWVLLTSAIGFIAALQAALYLKRPPLPAPALSPRREDPARSQRIAARAVAGTALALAGLALPLVWHTAAPIDTALPDKATGEDPAAIAQAWFPPDADVANNWPRFRGPDGSGITRLPGLPTTWDGPSGRNIRWKSPIELPGENSPVIWGDRVFFTGANDKRREIYCFDANTGALLWKQAVSTPQGDRAEPPEVLEDTGFAAPTATTDGRRVFAIFANGDVAGFTTTGNRLWIRSLGTPENAYGHAASLQLWQNRVIIVFDQADPESNKSKIMALDADTGAPVWTTARPVANSWVSPILIRHQGRDQIITAADPWVIAYDPATGTELWKANCMEGDVAASPAYANGLVYVGSDQTCIAAIKPDGTGDVSSTKIAWRQEEAGLPDMCSLLCDGPQLYSLVFGKLFACDALTGKSLWKHDTGAKFQASPTLFNGRLHLLTSDGVLITGEAGAEGFKEISRSALGENTGASPAFAPGRIYLRGKNHLFCIEAKDAK